MNYWEHSSWGGFVRRLRADWGDETTRLVAADWLEEYEDHTDPNAGERAKARARLIRGYDGVTEKPGWISPTGVQYSLLTARPKRRPVTPDEHRTHDVVLAFSGSPIMPSLSGVAPAAVEYDRGFVRSAVYEPCEWKKARVIGMMRAEPVQRFEFTTLFPQPFNRFATDDPRHRSEWTLDCPFLGDGGGHLDITELATLAAQRQILNPASGQPLLTIGDSISAIHDGEDLERALYRENPHMVPWPVWKWFPNVDDPKMVRACGGHCPANIFRRITDALTVVYTAAWYCACWWSGLSEQPSGSAEPVSHWTPAGVASMPKPIKPDAARMRTFIQHTRRMYNV